MLGWLDRSGFEADEWFWTRDCLEAPRCTSADSSAPCPSNSTGFVPVPLTSACVLLPVLREVVVPIVAFVARVLEACRVGHTVHAALPRVVGQPSQHHHGCLACALGLGCCSLYRLVALRSYVPCKVPSETRQLDRTISSLDPLGPERVEFGSSLSMRTCYLVDPASSHMLVSKIKPCMCKYELIRTVKLRMAH